MYRCIPGIGEVLWEKTSQAHSHYRYTTSPSSRTSGMILLDVGSMLRCREYRKITFVTKKWTFQASGCSTQSPAQAIARQDVWGAPFKELSNAKRLTGVNCKTTSGT